METISCQIILIQETRFIDISHLMINVLVMHAQVYF